MKATSLCVALSLSLVAGAVRAGDDTNRWHGGSFDGWDCAVAAGYETLGLTVTVTLSSGTNQVFDWTTASAALAPLTIAATEPAGTITNGGMLRVTVPAGWSCRFDPGASVTYGGGASGKVGAAGYTDGNRTLSISVTNDFAAGDTLAINGLKLADLRLVPPGTGQLALDFMGTAAPDANDAFTVAVRALWAGGPYDGWDRAVAAEYEKLLRIQGTIFNIQ